MSQVLSITAYRNRHPERDAADEMAQLTPPKAVELNASEQLLYSQIDWEDSLWVNWNHDRRLRMLESLRGLAESLLQREAIPKIRLQRLSSPEMHPSGRGKSVLEVFTERGTPWPDILSSPHFVSYLKYLIHGPDLPPASIEGFLRILREDRGTSGMVQDQIRAFVRKQMRDHDLRGDAADEFFLLAYECDRPLLADTVRQAAKTAKR
jgi:hypothetical protein